MFFGQQAKLIKCPKSGVEMSEFFPHLATVADQLCVIRSLKTEQINHDPAHTFMNTGTAITGRPSMGSWLLYGLGAETENLPGYIVLISTGKGSPDAADCGTTNGIAVSCQPVQGVASVRKATRCCTCAVPTA